MKNKITYFLWKWINSIYYSGNSVKCPLCNWNGSEFLNGRCPKCNSLPRQRLVPYCMKTFNLQEKRILHVGPNKSEYDYVVKMINPAVYDRVALSKNEIKDALINNARKILLQVQNTIFEHSASNTFVQITIHID